MQTPYDNSLILGKRAGGILVAAHRGIAGGNIPFNTRASFEAALFQGADILETDVIITREGELFIFHEGQEKAHLRKDIHLEEMTKAEIQALRYPNGECNATQFGLMTLDEFLETYKNRCLINLDHCWNFLPEAGEAVRRHGMAQQVILKAPAKLQFARAMSECAPELMFMPIYKEVDELTPAIEALGINYIGAELVFSKESSILCQDSYIQSHHDRGRLLWVNPILYNYKTQLTAGHSDDVAMMGDPDTGWGWLVDKGFDILQTDWVMNLKHYLQTR